MNIRKTVLSLALAAALVLPLGAPALAEETAPDAGVLGEQVDTWSVPLTGGAEVSGTIFWTGSDLRTEYLLTLAPESVAVPVVVSGDPLPAQRTLQEAAAALEAEGLHVLGGVNGGVYTGATGEPVGLTVSGGTLLHDDEGLHAVGFRADGSVVFGAPGLQMELKTEAGSFRIVAWNRASGDGFTAWTPNCAPAVDASEHSLCVFLRISEAPGLSGVTEAAVTEIRAAGGEPVAVPEGTVMLMLPPYDEDTPCTLPPVFAPGAEMTIETRCAAGWEDVDSAIGILYPLLQDGAVLPKLTASAAPRTAIGVRADGTLLLYALDGRQSGYSVGGGLSHVAQRMQELGCVTAGALDGGGSTQLAAFLPGEEALRIMSHPSESPTRKVAHYILLAARTEPTGRAQTLTLDPIHINAVAGATLPLTVRASDENGYAAPLPDELSFTVSEGLGEVADGVYTAAGTGSGAIRVSAPGLESGEIPLRVTESPEELALYGEKYNKKTESLTLEPGQEVDLTVRAYDRHILLSGNDRCYTWELDEAVGTVDESGHVTAGSASAEGTLRVTAGETVKEIPIKVWSGVPFTDVARSDPYFDAVKYVYDHSIFKGTGETTFEPQTVMNRAMLVTVLWRMEGQPAADAYATFADVEPGEWYADAVAWAAENGIVNGYSPEVFGPKDDLTREQILTILHRWAGLPEPPEDGEAFPEDAAADDWALSALKWAAAAGIYVDSGEGFPPARAPMTRADVSDALMRYETLVRPNLDVVTEESEK